MVSSGLACPSAPLLVVGLYFPSLTNPTCLAAVLPVQVVSLENKGRAGCAVCPKSDHCGRAPRRMRRSRPRAHQCSAAGEEHQPRLVARTFDFSMLHGVLIALHTGFAALAFVAGILLIFVPKHTAKPWLVRLYAWSVVALVVFVAGAIADHWAQLARVQRLSFVGLVGLGLYMIHRAMRASRARRLKQTGWREAFVADVGFTLISLFDGFVIVSAIDLGAPGWLVALSAVLGVVGGTRIIRLARSITPASPWGIRQHGPVNATERLDLVPTQRSLQKR
jgi:hypothetical protein